MLLEAGTVTGARSTRATPAGLRSEGGPRPGPCCPSLTSAAFRHPSGASKHLVRPRTPGVTTSGRGPQRAPSASRPSAGCWGPAGRHGARPSEQGQDLPGVALSQGLTLLSYHLLPAAPRRGWLVSEPVVPHHTSLTQHQKTAATALPVTGDSRILRSGFSYIIVTASGFQVSLQIPALNTY